MRKILFDLDGTLTDSGEGIMHCAELTLQHYGLPVPDRAELRSIVGPPLKDSFLRLGIEKSELDNAVEFYRKHYVAVGQFENFPYPGIREVLAKLKQDGHKLYVATSKPEAMAQNILRHFKMDEYFEIICGAVSDGQRSTKDEVIAHLLTLLDDNKDMVMVGDTIFDVKGAAFHGIPCIAVTWGYGVVEDMKTAGARIVDTMQQLYRELK